MTARGQRSFGSGVRWSAVSRGMNLASQLVGVLLLARLLPPTDFGLLAMTTMVTGFAGLFRDMGTSAAVIQRQALGQALLEAVFSFNLLVSLALCLLLLLLAPALAWVFAEPRLEPVIRFAALVFPLTGLALVQRALLERELRFRGLALLESGAVMVGLAVAVGLALHGWGIYALVAQLLVVALINAIGLWHLSKWRPAGPGKPAALADIIGFSARLFGFNLFNYFARNADNALIGRFLGSAALGIYAIGYKLMLWPLQNVSVVIGRALLPAMSREQQDHAVLIAMLLKVTRLVAFVTAPLMLGLALLRDDFVLLVLGERWLAVAPLLVWLAPIGFLQSVGTAVGNVYVATGRTGLLLGWGMLAGSSIAVAMAIGLRWGLEGVVIGYFAASALLFVPSIMLPGRIVGLRLGQYLAALQRPLVAAAGMGLCMTLAASVPMLAEAALAIRLALLVLLGGAVYAGASLLWQRDTLTDLQRAILGK